MNSFKDNICYRDSFFQPEEIEARAKNFVIPPLSTIILPPVSGYDERKKKPSKPDKEDNSEEENVGEEQEETGGNQVRFWVCPLNSLKGFLGDFVEFDDTKLIY